MIKKIKNFICKLLGIKQCACSEDMDPHEELMLHVPEQDEHLELYEEVTSRKQDKVNRKHKKGSE